MSELKSQTFCGDESCHLDREKKMVLDKERGFHCDPCIAKIVAALNDAGVKTVASCCGHGFRPGNIALADGREIIIARGYAEGRKIDAVSECDINGDVMPATRHSSRNEVLEEAAKPFVEYGEVLLKHFPKNSGFWLGIGTDYERKLEPEDFRRLIAALKTTGEAK